MLNRSTPLGELLTGTAHDPIPTDVTLSIGERFAGKTLLGVVIAKDRCAVARIGFDVKGEPKILGIRQVENRSRDLGQILTAESKAIGAQDVFLAIALGWTMDLGACSSRRAEHQDAFERFRMMQITPENVFPEAKNAENVYTVVDHPTLDRSVVFSLRRPELIRYIEDVRRAGLRVVCVRCLVASLLELWVAKKGVEGLSQDLLVSDGASAFLLNVREGDFALPASLDDSKLTRPRQTNNRPNDVMTDMTGYVADNASRQLTFLGPADAVEPLREVATRAGGHLVVPDAVELKDGLIAALSPLVTHDLNPDMKEERPRIHRSKRKQIYAYMGACVMCVLVLGFHVWMGFSTGLAADSAETADQSAIRRATDAKNAIEANRLVLKQAEGTRKWVWGNYHAQEFFVTVMNGLPPDASLEMMNAKLADGSAQMLFTFTVNGTDLAKQEQCLRSMEKSLTEKAKFNIGDRGTPIANGRSVTYAWKLLLPVANQGDVK